MLRDVKYVFWLNTGCERREQRIRVEDTAGSGKRKVSVWCSSYGQRETIKSFWKEKCHKGCILEPGVGMVEDLVDGLHSRVTSEWMSCKWTARAKGHVEKEGRVKGK